MREFLYLATPWVILFSVKKKSIDIAQKMKFSIKNFFSKCDQIRSFLFGFGHIYWNNP